MRDYYMYILTNKSNSMFFIGITDNLEKRMEDHLHQARRGFSSLYNLDRLVYYEVFPLAMEAIDREKRIKSWRKCKKEALIESKNPNWENLYQTATT